MMEDNRLAEWLCALLSDPNDAAPTGGAWQPTPDDWNALLDLARRHGVLPLFYVKLKAQRQPVDVPSAILNQLQQAYLHNAVRNMRLYHDLSQVLAHLHAAKIPVIVLKGAYLAEAVYGNIALRPMCDIDLLVPEQDILRARDGLLETGYTPARPFWFDAERQHHHHLPPFQKEGGMLIELHWSLVSPPNPFTIDIAGLWDRAQTTHVAGNPVLTFAPEDLLVYLCVHGTYAHQLLMSLRVLLDIAEVIRYYQDRLNWDAVGRLADQWNASKAVYITLYFAKQLLSATVPESLLQRLQPSDLTADLLVMLHARVLHGEASITRNIVNLWHANGGRQKMHILFQRLFPSPSEMSCIYPVAPTSLRVYLYYPKRVLELFGRYRRTFRKLWQREVDATTTAAQQKAYLDWLIAPIGQNQQISLN